jgi:acyl dehydratase
MKLIENRVFDEIKVGDTASLTRTLTQRDIEIFAAMSGDINPIHTDEEFAHQDLFHRIIAHGMWGGALISTVLGTELPGPGTIYRSQTLAFRHPIAVGDTVVVSVMVKEKKTQEKSILLQCRLTNQDGEVVIDGLAEVLAPPEKIRRAAVELPEIHLEDPGYRHRQLIAQAADYEPIHTAVVYPVDQVSLAGAIEAAKAKLIVPLLIGPLLPLPRRRTPRPPRPRRWSSCLPARRTPS